MSCTAVAECCLTMQCPTVSSAMQHILLQILNAACVMGSELYQPVLGGFFVVVFWGEGGCLALKWPRSTICNSKMML